MSTYQSMEVVSIYGSCIYGSFKFGCYL